MKKRSRNILITILALILVLLFCFFIFKARVNIEQFSTIKEEEIYYYIDDYKNSYIGKIVLDKNDNISQLLNIEDDLNDIFEPIYFQNKDVILFTNNMSIIRPTMGFKQNKLLYYTTVEKKDDNIIIKNSVTNTTIANSFIFDGINTYFFLDNVKIILGDKEIELSPLSYVRCAYKDYVYIYDYSSKNMTTFKNVDYIVYAETDNYKINLSTDNVAVGNKSIILIKNIDKLPVLR